MAAWHKFVKRTFSIDGPPPEPLMYYAQEQYPSLINPPFLYSTLAN